LCKPAVKTVPYLPKKVIPKSMSALIKVADAREKTRRGNNAGTYIVAVAGGMKFLLLRPNREDPNGSTGTLFVTGAAPGSRDPRVTPSAAWLPARRWSSVPSDDAQPHAAARSDLPLLRP
jgi:hypothetical protein